MKLTVNKREVQNMLPEDATLGEALSMAQAEQVGDDEVVAAIWVDGEPLTAERLSIWKDRSVDDFSEAAIEAPVRKTFAADGLRTIAEKLQESAVKREEIVDHITQGRGSEGIGALDEYLRVWMAVQQSLGSVGRLLEVDLDTLEYWPDQSDADSAKSVGEVIEQLAEQLREVKSALAAGDMILLGDIIDYEFGDITADWVQMLNQLAGQFDPQG